MHKYAIALVIVLLFGIISCDKSNVDNPSPLSPSAKTPPAIPPPEQSWEYKANASTPHNIGKFNIPGNYLESEKGVSGALAYGPYINLPAGKYKASFTLTAQSEKTGQQIGTVDINSASSTTPVNILKEAPILGKDGEQVITIDFQVPDLTTVYEFRVLPNGKGTVRFNTVKIATDH